MFFRYTHKYSVLLLWLSALVLSPTATGLTYSPDMQERIAQKIVHYEKLYKQGSFKPINLNKTLRIGDKGIQVADIVSRLAVTNDIAFDVCANNRKACEFTHIVRDSIIRFQKRHGVKADGVVGSNTQALLNTDFKDKIRSLKFSFNQLENIKDKLDNRFILVNIPAYSLQYIKNHEVDFESRVVVGKPRWKTPTMSDTMEYFVVNPYWRIPASIFY